MGNDPVSSISELPIVVVAKGYMKLMYPFFKKKKKKKKNTSGPPPPPPHAKGKKISHIMEIGALKAKITHNFFFWGGGGWGGVGIYTNSEKMGSECTICIRFSKIFSGRPRAPPPTARR